MQTRSALVAYATETGNAFEYAEELVRLLRRIHFLTRLSQLDELDTRSLGSYTLLIIVTSTTGQGDLPINGRLFWKKLLRKKLPPDLFQHVQFSTFGLGDSSYPKFNWAARKLHKRLLQLGATEVCMRGEADEQHEEGLDATFAPWSSSLRSQLLSIYPLPPGVGPIPESELLHPEWELVLARNVSNGTQDYLINGDASPASTNGPAQVNGQSEKMAPDIHSSAISNTRRLAVKLEENSRVTHPTHWQDVRQLVFSSDLSINYQPGDVLTIHPKNLRAEVDELLGRMDWVDVADKPIHFSRFEADDEVKSYSASPLLLPTTTTTLRTLLTQHLDITAIPRRSFFSMIAHFTNDQFHKERLLEFTKPEYIDELYDYTTRPRRSILEVLQEFESVKIPWQWATNVLPHLRGRQFSIASGGERKKTVTGITQFELLVAIVKYRTVIKKVREGVCTRYLAALPIGTELNVTLQKGSFAINEREFGRPVLLIGPGTGVAPLRSLIWERMLWQDDMRMKAKAYEVNGLGKSVLFFGCRNEAADYVYQEEWTDLKTRMPLEVHAAFSRDQSQKVYVQDLIRQQSECVYTLLHQDNGLVYVCGSSGKMPQAVRTALVDVLRGRGSMGQDDAEKYLEEMEKKGRYKQETW